MVLVTFKTIDLKSFQLEFPDTETVGEVKKKVAESQGEGFDTELQKMVYCGKTLGDGQTLNDIKYEPKKFIVVMLTKKKAIGGAVPLINREPIEKEAKTPVGIPVPVAGVPGAPLPLQIPILQGLSLDDIAAMPGFDVLRETAMMDPESLPELLMQFVNNEEVAAQVLAAVQQNPQAFLQMLQNAGGVANQMFPQVPGAVAPAARQLVRPALGTQAPLLNAPMFSANDREAIQRIISMGFPEPAAYEAYLVCDKNEVMAINYILQQMETKDEGTANPTQAQGSGIKENSTGGATDSK